jgi:hypothetical protein
VVETVFYSHSHSPTLTQVEKSAVHDMFFPMGADARQLLFKDGAKAEAKHAAAAGDDGDEKSDALPDGTAFCPVCLVALRLLVPGKIKSCVRMQGVVYSLCSPAHVDAFTRDPQRFHVTTQPDAKLFAHIPPPRVLVLGPRCAGKSQACAQLAQQLGGGDGQARDEPKCVGLTVDPDRRGSFAWPAS